MAKLSPETGSPMVPIQIGTLQLDVCRETGGIWFDLGEIGKILRIKADALVQIEASFQPAEGVPSEHPAHTCPNDKSRLISAFYGES